MKSKGGSSDISVSGFVDLVNAKRDISNIEEMIRLLALADTEKFVQQRGDLRVPLSQLFHKVLGAKAGKFSLSHLCSIVDHASSLNILTQADVNTIFSQIESMRVDTADSFKVDKIVLGLWGASLWHGFPTARFQNKGLAILSKQEVHLPDIARLSWCIYNDPLTKLDPGLKARVDGLVKSHLKGMSLKQLAEIGQKRLPEFSVVREQVLNEITKKITMISDLREDNRLPSQLLVAWMVQRTIPQDREFFLEVVRRCVQNRVNPDLVFEAVATLDLKDHVNMDELKKSLFRVEGWVPTVDQLSSLCHSFSTLGLFDLESTSFLARHLTEVLVNQNPVYHSDRHSVLNYWKIGAWYAAVVAQGSESTTAALQDGFRDLCTRIASGMWDNSGRFVRKVARTKIPPNERAIRSVVSQSLASLGIPTLSQIHIVNTPFIVPLLIPDKDVVLSLIPDEQVLESGEVVGQENLVKEIMESRGYQVRLLKVSEVESRHASESQDEFLAFLIRVIQSDVDTPSAANTAAA
jgi:hypothetical protein